MAQEFLVTEQLEAGGNFVREFCEYTPVSAAFWVNHTDSEDWYLYIASDEIGGTNTRKAYGEVIRRLSGQKTPWLDPMRIKLINSADLLAQEVIEFQDIYSLTTPFRWNRSSLGRMSIDGAYIYPRQSVMQPVP